MSTRGVVLVAVGAGLLLAACAGSAGTAGAGVGAGGGAMPSARASVITSPVPPTPLPAPPPAPARFRWTVSRIPPRLAAAMRETTWHPGCPVPLRDLRLLRLRYVDFHGRTRHGPMVVNATVARDVGSVFRTLFRARFPIEQVHLAIPYRGVDDPTDRRDYTMGFNCRPALTARGPLATWSQHAYGLAVDVNPLRNPYVTADGFVRNYHARRFRDRSQHALGMIHPGDVVTRAFAAIGWTWGGDWSRDKDYMHFSLTGG